MKPMTMAARLATAALLMASTVLALAATNAPTASLWSRMWRTPDQRGQALLRQGDAAGAAQEFVDPQRKGHASHQAHDYAGASKTLSGVDTAEAHYNRGNALAHTGDLQGSFSIYVTNQRMGIGAGHGAGKQHTGHIYISRIARNTSNLIKTINDLAGLAKVLVFRLSLIHISSPRDRTSSRMPSSA